MEVDGSRWKYMDADLEVDGFDGNFHLLPPKKQIVCYDIEMVLPLKKSLRACFFIHITNEHT